MKKYKVFMNNTYITSFSKESEAEHYINRCKREDANELREGYGFPHGLPVYEIRTK